MRRTIGLGVAGLALVALTVLARRLARLEPVLVQGDSMRPTLRPGQRLAVGPLDLPPRRGDLVVVGREGFEVVKRVVGLPGERLRLAGGRLEVDGVEVAEPYLAGSAGGDLEPVFESAEWLVVAVNTTRWYRHEDGEVSPAQVERVEARLAAALPSQLRVVVTHQPVMVTRQEDMHNRLHGRETAVARWCAAGADLILGGHIHLPFVRPLHDAYAGCPRTTWAVQAGTAVSSRVRAGHPNSVNVLRMENIGGTRVCQAERWDHSSAHKAFVCGKVLRLRLASGAVLP